MQVDNGNTIFNLWDTNGRRNDVINALHLYLEILNENDDVKAQGFSAFPESLGQYCFYKAAIELSADVFKVHPQFDYFSEKYSSEIALFLNGKRTPLIDALAHCPDDRSILDAYIEARSRHYVNCLKKFGFASADWKITPAGLAFLKEEISRDEIEEALPLSNANISLLRQLLKLRIYSKTLDDGKRRYFSPFKMAMLTLLQKGDINSKEFLSFIQSGSPYREHNPFLGIKQYFDEKNYSIFLGELPSYHWPKAQLSQGAFESDFYNMKSATTSEVYYKFYELLYPFLIKRDQGSFDAMNNYLFNSANKYVLEKAFGFGSSIFDYGQAGQNISLEIFLGLNSSHDLLIADNINEALFIRFIKSKFVDIRSEYADTTRRMLDACGLVKFNKGIASLSYRPVMEVLFDQEELAADVFGRSTEEEFTEYEKYGSCHSASRMGNNDSFTAILGYDSNRIAKIIKVLEERFGGDIQHVKETIREKTNADFVAHVEEKYPVEKVLELLRLFPGRTHDSVIKNYVNKEATIPTIYEFISAIAWFYISNKDFNLYDSLNLTLNADFEPVLHAGGGDGDIIAKEKNRVVMLEVTLMDASSQGRGEMEPVRRHSANLKAKYSSLGLETYTFFISSELAENTVSDWRYLFPAPIVATLSSARVNNVLIMSFTDAEICAFLEKGVTSDLIIEKTKAEFANGTPAPTWRDDVVKTILA